MTDTLIQTKGTGGTALTISLGSLASSTARVGRQSTIVLNATPQFNFAIVHVKITLGTSPTGNTGVYVHLIRSDSALRDDEAGASDAALTMLNAPLLGILKSGPSPSTGEVLIGSFLVDPLGLEWGIGIWHDTVAALNSTGGNHVVDFVGYEGFTEDAP